jgi:hypothetical protein
MVSVRKSAVRSGVCGVITTRGMGWHSAIDIQLQESEKYSKHHSKLLHSLSCILAAARVSFGSTVVIVTVDICTSICRVAEEKPTPEKANLSSTRSRGPESTSNLN